MNAAHIQATYRGVCCRCCNRPVRLSASFIQREMSVKQERPGLIQELRSQVFGVASECSHTDGSITTRLFVTQTDTPQCCRGQGSLRAPTHNLADKIGLTLRNNARDRQAITPAMLRLSWPFSPNKTIVCRQTNYPC